MQKDNFKNSIPPEFLCPLSLQVMHDPVIIPPGQSFERKALEAWFNKCKQAKANYTNPITLQEIDHTAVLPNENLKKIISAWHKSMKKKNSTIKNGKHLLKKDHSKDSFLSSHTKINSHLTFSSVFFDKEEEMITKNYLSKQKTLTLDSKVSNRQARYLAMALQSNTSIHSLTIRADEVSPVNIAMILTSLRHNRSIVTLKFIANHPVDMSGILAQVLITNHALCYIRWGNVKPNPQYIGVIHPALINNQRMGRKFLDAAAKGELIRVKDLIEHGVSVYYQDDKTMNTALHYAVQYQQTEVIKLLLSHSMNPELVNCEGETPYILATRLGKEKIVSLFWESNSPVQISEKIGIKTH